MLRPQPAAADFLPWSLCSPAWGVVLYALTATVHAIVQSELVATFGEAAAVTKNEQAKKIIS